MSKATKNKAKPTHTGDNGGAPSGKPQNQRSSSLAEGAFATTEHPHAPTNESPFAESKWSFADQLLNLRGGMVSAIGDIFKLNKAKQAATERMNRIRKDMKAQTRAREFVEIDVKGLKAWRETTKKDINDIVGATPVSPIGTKNLTELTANMSEQNEVNLDVNKRLLLLEGLVFGLIVVAVVFAFSLAGTIWYFHNLTSSI